MAEMWALAIIAFSIGLAVGGALEARLWRLKGDHDYMNTMESRGRIYKVKCERHGDT